MILEHATPADLPAIAALMNRAYRGRGEVMSWNSEEAYLEGDRTSVALLEADLTDKPAARQLVVRDEAGTIIASVWLEPLGDGVWYLGSLATDPSLQNAGLGRRILAASEEWVRERGAHTVRMTVINIRDTLIAWYLRRGYALTGKTEAFPYDDHRFGVPTRDDLNFVVLEKTLGAPPS